MNPLRQADRWRGVRKKRVTLNLRLTALLAIRSSVWFAFFTLKPSANKGVI
jgi:hypothetical protein